MPVKWWLVVSGLIENTPKTNRLFLRHWRWMVRQECRENLGRKGDFRAIVSSHPGRNN
jgi:hypothetical protein